MTRALVAELAVAVPAELGEAPAFDAVNNRLLWVDVFAGLVHAATPGGTIERTWEVGRPVTAALPSRSADVLLTIGTTFAVLSGRGDVRPVLSLDLAGSRFNDAKCDPYGRAVAGTMALDAHPGAGALLRLDPGGPGRSRPHTTVLLGERTVSNGLAWSAQGDRLYYIDTLDRRIACFAYSPTARLGHPLSVINVPAAEGNADGMCIDDAGCLWVAMWDGSCVRRYTPDGIIDTVVNLPVRRPTSCCFAGGTLFITSAHRRLDERTELDGCVFAVEPGVTGPPATPWAAV